MGGALARGLHRIAPAMRIFTTQRGAPLPAFVTACASNAELAARSETILLCVKPRQAAGVLREIAPKITPRHRVISTCAAVTLRVLQRALPGTALARCMPNLACEFGAGISALAFGDAWTYGGRDETAALFESMGETFVLEERHFDAVTALSGCGPAYICVAIEALSEGGVRAGLPRAVSTAMAVQMVLGSAQLLKRAKEHPAAVRERVTTPGGCTIEALVELEERGFRAAIIAAVHAAARKSALLRSEGPVCDVPPRAVDGGALTA